jgi:hypothetical protein
MLRKRHQYRLLTAAFLFALIGVAFFAGGLGVRLQSPQEDAAQSSISHGDRDSKSSDSVWRKTTTDPVAIATLALVIVTFFMTRAIYAQVKLARQEFIATHRPKIRVRYLETASVRPVFHTPLRS